MQWDFSIAMKEITINSQLDINPNLNVVFTDETTKFTF